MSEQPIRVLVTRPAEDAAPVADRLSVHGLVPVVEPLLQIVPLPDRSLDLADAQAVLLTSRNGARALAGATEARDVRVLAVGEATAAAARAAGFERVESAGGAVADLARLASTRLDPEAGRLVHVSGAETAGDLAGTLRGEGFTVDRVVLYKAVPATMLSETACALIREERLSIALFFSPRTAATFAALVAGAGLAERCGAVCAVFVSPAAARAGDGVPWRESRTAARPNADAMIDEAVEIGRALHPGRDENG